MPGQQHTRWGSCPAGSLRHFPPLATCSTPNVLCTSAVVNRMSGSVTGARTALLSSVAMQSAAPQHQLGTSMLQSLQRRFLQQQVLCTPCSVADSQNDSEDLEGFVLHSQPTYERVVSQRPLETAALGASNSDELEETQFDCHVMAPSTEDGNEEMAIVESHAQQMRRRCSGAGGLAPMGSQWQRLDSGEVVRRTPGIHSVERIPVNGGGSAGKLFPIFRSKKDLKVGRHACTLVTALATEAFCGRGNGHPSIPLNMHG
jgi:hypothetical protein